MPKEIAAQWVSEGTRERSAAAWKLLESQLPLSGQTISGRFALGTDQPTFLDLYIALVAHWAPEPRCAHHATEMYFAYHHSRHTWFKDNCPRLTAVIEELIKTSPLIKRTFEENHLNAFF